MSRTKRFGWLLGSLFLAFGNPIQATFTAPSYAAPSVEEQELEALIAEIEDFLDTYPSRLRTLGSWLYIASELSETQQAQALAYSQALYERAAAIYWAIENKRQQAGPLGEVWQQPSKKDGYTYYYRTEKTWIAEVQDKHKAGQQNWKEDCIKSLKTTALSPNARPVDVYVGALAEIEYAKQLQEKLHALLAPYTPDIADQDPIIPLHAFYTLGAQLHDQCHDLEIEARNIYLRNKPNCTGIATAKYIPANKWQMQDYRLYRERRDNISAAYQELSAVLAPCEVTLSTWNDVYLYYCNPKIEDPTAKAYVEDTLNAIIDKDWHTIEKLYKYWEDYSELAELRYMCTPEGQDRYRKLVRLNDQRLAKRNSYDHNLCQLESEHKATLTKIIEKCRDLLHIFYTSHDFWSHKCQNLFEEATYLRNHSNAPDREYRLWENTLTLGKIIYGTEASGCPIGRFSYDIKQHIQKNRYLLKQISTCPITDPLSAEQYNIEVLKETIQTTGYGILGIVAHTVIASFFGPATFLFYILGGNMIVDYQHAQEPFTQAQYRLQESYIATKGAYNSIERFVARVKNDVAALQREIASNKLNAEVIQKKKAIAQHQLDFIHGINMRKFCLCWWNRDDMKMPCSFNLTHGELIDNHGPVYRLDKTPAKTEFFTYRINALRTKRIAAYQEEEEKVRYKIFDRAAQSRAKAQLWGKIGGTILTFMLQPIVEEIVEQGIEAIANTLFNTKLTAQQLAELSQIVQIENHIEREAALAQLAKKYPKQAAHIRKAFAIERTLFLNQQVLQKTTTIGETQVTQGYKTTPSPSLGASQQHKAINMLKSKSGDPVRDAELLGKKMGTGFKQFKKTPYYYRNNLKTFDKAVHGIDRNMPSNVHAHHILPQQHVAKFKKLGINPNDPCMMAWMQDEAHRQLHKGGAYNFMWEEFLNENPTQEAVFAKLFDIIAEHKNTMDSPFLAFMAKG